LLICAALSGCAALQLDTVPTLFPTEQLPTVIALTAGAAASQTPQPTEGIQPTETPSSVLLSTMTLSPTATLTATIEHSPTPTPTPTLIIPEADIQITNPGPLSKVVSPFTLTSHLIPADPRRAEVALWGEDGRLIYRRLFVFKSLNERTSIATRIPFETSAVAETGRLVIQVKDEHNRLVSLASHELILMTEGEADVNVPGDLLTPIVITKPEEKVLVQGDVLDIAGWVRIPSGHNLLVELVAADGRVVGSRLADIEPGPEGEHTPFVAEVPFQVEAPTWARVTISDRKPGVEMPLNLASIEVLLSP
jgi:hypothetical protein